MSFSDVQLDLFCLCQNYYLNRNGSDYFLNTIYKISRDIPSNPNLENIKKYLVPTYLDSFHIDNVLVKLDYTLYFHPKKIKEEIRKLKKKITITPEIKEYFHESIETAKEALEKVRESDVDLLFISIRLESKENNFNQHLVEKIWGTEKLKNIFVEQEKYMSESRRGFVCSRLFFHDDYKIIGDVLPRPLPLPKDVESQVGETQIKGFKLIFKDSKMGLKTLNIAQTDGMWDLYYKVTYLTKKLRDIYPKGLELLVSLSKIFLEEK